MTAVATAWTVPGSGDRKMRVSRENGHVDFTWLCGDQRSFSVAALEEAIANLELLRPHGVWMKLRDRHGSAFVALVQDGRFYADTAPRDVGEGAMSVPWTDLRDLIAPPAPKPEWKATYTVKPQPKRGLLRRVLGW